MKLKPSEHACKISFNYSKLCANKVKILPPKHALDAFRTNSRNIIGRNPSMVIPLLANQDLAPMLLGFAIGSYKDGRDLVLYDKMDLQT